MATNVTYPPLGDALPYEWAASLPATLSEFRPYDASTWTPQQTTMWAAVVLLGLELLSWLIMQLAPFFSVLPLVGTHLDRFSKLDWAFIVFNKLTTVFFTYHLLRYTWTSTAIAWDAESFSWGSTLLTWALFHIVYDFFYTLFHLALHVPSLYPYIHKHHHRQVNPSRGNMDAVNVHPVEFVLGEYNHILAVFLVANFAPVKTHAAAVLLFLLVGGVLASLNHTRFDIRIPGFFMVRAHDVHHQKFKFNFGQYIMLWDRVFGTFRDHTNKVLPAGTTVEEAKAHKKKLQEDAKALKKGQ